LYHLGQRKPAGEAVCSFRDQVHEPRAAWPREIASAFALRQGEEQVGQGDVRAEPRQKAVTAIASGPIASRAFDAHDVQGELAERM
jgi:hypothetical protein